MTDYDLRCFQLTVAHPGSRLLLATCVRPGCHWQMSFSTGQLSLIVDTCVQHPCGAERDRDPAPVVPKPGGGYTIGGVPMKTGIVYRPRGGRWYEVADDGTETPVTP